MSFELWVQDCDYSDKEHGLVTYEQACEFVRTHPWLDHAESFAECMERGDDCCPPGVGISRDGNKNVFHLYITCVDEWELFLQLHRTEKIFGLIPKSARTFQVCIKSLEDIQRLLGFFFAGYDDQLIEEVRRFPAA